MKEFVLIEKGTNIPYIRTNSEVFINILLSTGAISQEEAVRMKAQKVALVELARLEDSIKLSKAIDYPVEIILTDNLSSLFPK